MRKNYLFVMLAAVMLLAASCSDKELAGVQIHREAPVTFVAQLPDGLQNRTRAFGDGTTATTLSCFVYDEEWSYIDDLSSVRNIALENLKANVELKLVNGKKYNVVFWADAGETSPYTFDTATGTVNMNYENAPANAENRDAFVQVVELEVNGGSVQTVHLQRPFAQINIGTTDWAEVEKSDNVSITKTSVSVVDAYSTFAFNGKSAEVPVTASFVLADMPGTDEAFPNSELGVDKYLSMNYILTSTEKSLVDITIGYDDTDVPSRTFTQVPVQRNYRTNIYGILITSDNDFDVEVKAEFAGEEIYPPTIDISSGGTAVANCYIVSEAGKYKFPATYKGNETTASIEKSSIASAEVLWESFGTSTAPNVKDLISEVSYNAENGYVTFTASSKKGNSVIAVKDADGTILWSWHIWMTDAPQDQVYNNGAGIMMDRNIGALSVTPSDGVLTYGLLYQWGRKDPFCVYHKGTTNNGNWKRVSMKLSPEDVATAPMTLVEPSGGTVYWYSGEDVYDLWKSEEKTVYDPCPVGYRMPKGGPDGVWSTAFGSSDEDTYPVWDSENYGYDLGGTEDGVKHLASDGCWYPAAGFKFPFMGSGTANRTSEGAVWSATKSSSGHAYRFHITKSKVDPNSNEMHNMGNSVRCIKE